MQYEVSPIVFEGNDPVKIRAAFKAGCGGVIVDQNVPATVTAEIATLRAQAAQHSDMIEKLQTILLSDDTQTGGYYWPKPEECLSETHRWLEEVWARAVSQRFARPPASGISSGLVSVWLGSGINLPWHIDKQREDRWLDIHLHISGEGLHVASPPLTLEMPFSGSRGSPELKMTKGGYEGIYQIELDRQLQEQNVSFLRLQPGQMLYFNQHCLHKSDRGPLDAARPDVKLRAGIF